MKMFELGGGGLTFWIFHWQAILFSVYTTTYQLIGGAQVWHETVMAAVKLRMSKLGV